MAARIIIADGMATNRIALKSTLCTARHMAMPAATEGAARTHLEAGGIGLLILDLDLPGDPLGLLKSVRADRATATLPVIATLDRPDPALRIAALEAGADDIVLKPVAAVALLARVRSLLRAADTRAALSARADTVRDLGFAEAADAFAARGRIAVVSRNRALSHELLKTIGLNTTHAVEAMVPDRALTLADGPVPPDLFVLHADPDHPSGTLQLLTDLRAQSAARHSAIALIHDRADAETGAMALDLGASTLIEAGVSEVELGLQLDIQIMRKQEGDRLRAAVEERLRLAVEDPLTGLFNRRYAMAHLKRLAQGPGTDRTCILLADLDRFKSVNDRFGHPVGDAVLTEVAHRLRDNLRAPDMVARLGGEEFLIILTDTDPSSAFTTAERLCDLIRSTPVTPPGGVPPVPVTISLGLAMMRAGEPMEAAINRADRALYDAKSAGRDKVTVSSGSCAA